MIWPIFDSQFGKCCDVHQQIPSETSNVGRISDSIYLIISLIPVESHSKAQKRALFNFRESLPVSKSASTPLTSFQILLLIYSEDEGIFHLANTSGEGNDGFPCFHSVFSYWAGSCIQSYPRINAVDIADVSINESMTERHKVVKVKTSLMWHSWGNIRVGINRICFKAKCCQCLYECLIHTDSNRSEWFDSNRISVTVVTVLPLKWHPQATIFTGTQ